MGLYLFMFSSDLIFTLIDNEKCLAVVLKVRYTENRPHLTPFCRSPWNTHRYWGNILVATQGYNPLMEYIVWDNMVNFWRLNLAWQENSVVP